MSCPLTSNLPLLLTVVIAGVVIMYFTNRKDTSCNAPVSTRMQPTKLIVYGLTYPYTLPPLTFENNALEAHIDAETMTLHHTKHHQTYIDNVNKALQSAPEEYQQLRLEDLLTNLPALPPAIRETVRNNGGGHFAHTLFWDSLSPQSTGKPTNVIVKEINASFGSFESFKEQFQKSAAGHVGSGWTWLCLTPAHTLSIVTTLNHDTPLAQGLYPIMVLDVWEHAYYLKYRNKRGDFITAWWNIINWEHVEKLYHDGLKKV